MFCAPARISLRGVRCQRPGAESAQTNTRRPTLAAARVQISSVGAFRTELEAYGISDGWLRSTLAADGVDIAAEGVGECVMANVRSLCAIGFESFAIQELPCLSQMLSLQGNSAKGGLLEWTRFLRRSGLEDHEIRSLFKFYPHVLLRSSVYHAGMMMLLLREQGQMSAADVARSLFQKPDMICQDCEDKLYSALSVLEEFGFGRQKAVQLVADVPEALDRAPQELRMLLEVLEAHKLEPLEVLSLRKSLLLADMRELQDKLTFLISAGFTTPDIVYLGSVCPDILLLPFRQVKMRWKFLQEEIGGGIEDVLPYTSYLLKDPFLSIAPRLMFARSLPGAMAALCSADDPGRISLPALAQGSDMCFCKRIGAELAHYRSFMRETYLPLRESLEDAWAAKMGAAAGA